MGIVNEEDYRLFPILQVLDPHYKLHENMMQFVSSALKDADVILFVTDIYENGMNHKDTFERLQNEHSHFITHK